MPKCGVCGKSYKTDEESDRCAWNDFNFDHGMEEDEDVRDE